MELLVKVYLALSVLVFLGLFAAWRRNTMLNFIIKFFLGVLTLFGTFCLFKVL